MNFHQSEKADGQLVVKTKKKNKLAVRDNTIPFVLPHAASSVFHTIIPSSCGFAAQVRIDLTFGGPEVTVWTPLTSDSL